MAETGKVIMMIDLKMNITTLQKCLAILWKAKRTTTSWVLTYRYTRLLLNINERLLKAYIHAKNYRQMFTTPLIVTSLTWKQPKFPSSGEGINTFWYTHSMDYYSAKKKLLKLVFNTKTWMNLSDSTEWKKLTKENLYDSICMKVCKMQTNQ